MRDGVAGDRAEGVRLLDVAIAATASSSERETLVSERERLWEVEERHRALADAIWRDCMAEVRRTRRASTE